MVLRGPTGPTGPIGPTGPDIVPGMPGKFQRGSNLHLEKVLEQVKLLTCSYYTCNNTISCVCVLDGESPTHTDTHTLIPNIQPNQGRDNGSVSGHPPD